MYENTNMIKGKTGRKVSIKTGAPYEKDTDVQTCRAARGVSDGYLPTW